MKSIYLILNVQPYAVAFFLCEVLNRLFAELQEC